MFEGRSGDLRANLTAPANPQRRLYACRRQQDPQAGQRHADAPSSHARCTPAPQSIAQATQQTGNARSAEILRQLDQQRAQEKQLADERDRLRGETGAAEAESRQLRSRSDELEKQGEALDQE